MGFLIKPAIALGSSLLGGWLGKKSQNAAQQRSPEEQAALSSATGAGNALTQTGTKLTGMGLPAVNKSLGYYSTLLGGNRGAMSLATASPRASLTDTYAGAQQNLEQSGVRGAARDEAVANLARDKAGKIAGLTTGVQPGAASALADIGTNLTSQGGQQQQAAGSLFSNLLNQGFNNRKYARSEGEKAGAGIGGLLFNVLSGLGGKNTGISGGGPLSPYGGGGAGDQGPGQW